MYDQKPTVIAPVKGQGSRLYSLTLYDSKSLIGIANQPTLERIFENFAAHGCRNFWIIGEYQLYSYFRRGDGFSERLRLEPEALFSYTTEKDVGNADGVRKLLEKTNKNGESKIQGEVFIIGGDNFTDINVDEMLKTHRDSNADLTVALTEVEDVSQYGIAKLDNKKIVEFIEKPKPENAPTKLGSMFCYLTSASVLREFLRNEGKTFTDFGSQVIPAMVKSYEVYGYEHKGYWKDIGSPETLLQTSLDIIKGKVRGMDIEDRIHPTTQRNIGHNVNMENVLIGANAEIGDNVKLKNVCIEDNCIIEDGADIENSMIYFSTKVGKQTKVKQSIIGRFAYTGERSVIGGYETPKISVIGNDVKLGNDSWVWSGELLAHYTREDLFYLMEKIENAKVGERGLYEIVGFRNDINVIYFTSKKTLWDYYGGQAPPIPRRF